ncbi:FxsA family protein [Candidatus Pelagibacter sp.]|nr:FxsA family protein [Candidatus Pelagibacter sp.]
MNTALFLIIGIPLIEIYLFIKIGSQIGAFNTVLLILTTAIVGVAYARYEGFNTLKSGLSQIVKNVSPIYEIVSGAALAFAAFLLILPGFATDLIGVLLIIPLTRKIILKKYINKNSHKRKNNNNYIDGDYEDISDDNDKKI